MSSNQGSSMILVACALGAMLLGLPADAKKAARAASGETVFKQQCASCHAGGGNTVKPGKPLVGSTKLESMVLFSDYLRAPVGHMPYYKNIVGDKQTMKALFDYCKTLKPPKQA